MARTKQISKKSEHKDFKTQLQEDLRDFKKRREALKERMRKEKEKEIAKKKHKKRINSEVSLKDQFTGLYKKFENFESLQFPILSFQRLVCETLRAVCYHWSLKPNLLRIDKDAVHLIQHFTEDWFMGIMEDSYLCACHAGRVTLQLKDLKLAMRIRNDGLIDYKLLEKFDEAAVKDPTLLKPSEIKRKKNLDLILNGNLENKKEKEASSKKQELSLNASKFLFNYSFS